MSEQSRTVKYPAVPAGDVLSDDGTFIPPGGGPATPTARAIQAVMREPQGSTLPVGTHVDLIVPYDLTLDVTASWLIRAPANCSVVLDVQRATVAAPGTFASIAAAAKPTLSSDNYASGAMTGWSPSLLAGETVRIVVESASGTSECSLAIPAEDA